MNFYILWNGSFGHTISSLDTFARLTYPKKGYVIHITHPRSNEYLCDLYPHLNSIKLKPGKSKYFSYKIGRIIYNLIRFLFKLITIIPGFYVYDRSQLYSLLKQGPDNFISGSDDNKTIVNYNNITGWGFLVRNKKIPITPFQRIINDKYCVVHLRYKGNELNNPGNYLRNRENPLLYSKLFDFINNEKIVEKIILILDNQSDIEHFIDKDYIINFKGGKKEGISLVQNAEFYVCQHSGPVNLCNVLDTPVYITEALPWWQGTYNSRDLVLFKKAQIGSRVLKLNELYDLPVESWMIYEKGSKINIIPNSSVEILQGFKEFYYNEKSEERIKKLIFLRKNIKKNILQKYLHNRISTTNFE